MEREQGVWVGTSREKCQEDRESPMKGKSRGPGSVCSLAEAAIMTWGGVLENEFWEDKLNGLFNFAES